MDREEFFNQLWKELLEHGQYRRAREKSCRSAAQGDPAGSRAHGEAGAGKGPDEGAGKRTSLKLGITDREIEICGLLGISVPEYVVWRLPDPPPHAEHLPDGGIRVGEIIAYRWWRITYLGSGLPYLRSCLTKWVWPHGCALEADRDPVEERHGIYCYKTQEIAAMEPMGVVLGRVAVWGRMVEHANGYRVQFARPIAFDHTIPTHTQLDLVRLRRAYGLPEDGSLPW